MEEIDGVSKLVMVVKGDSLCGLFEDRVRNECRDPVTERVRDT